MSAKILAVAKKEYTDALKNKVFLVFLAFLLFSDWHIHRSGFI